MTQPMREKLAQAVRDMLGPKPSMRITVVEIGRGWVTLGAKIVNHDGDDIMFLRPRRFVVGDSFQVEALALEVSSS